MYRTGPAYDHQWKMRGMTLVMDDYPIIRIARLLIQMAAKHLIILATSVFPVLPCCSRVIVAVTSLGLKDQ